MRKYYVFYKSRWHKARRMDDGKVCLSTPLGYLCYAVDSDLVKIKEAWNMKKSAPTSANIEAHAKWKASASALGFDFYTMKQAIKANDLMRQAQRNDKRQRIMLGSDFE